MSDKNKGVVQAFNEIWKAASTRKSSYDKWVRTNVNPQSAYKNGKKK